jgi:CRISPR-associated protein Csm2
MRDHRGARPGGAWPGSGAGSRERREGGDPKENQIVQILKGADKIELWTTGTDRRTLRPELLDGEARKQAEELREVSSSQLRRFYGTAVAFRQRLQMDPQIGDNEVQAQLAYLKASSAYAAARKQPEALVKFFAAAANSVKSRDDYFCFARHFEAVMAFHKVFGMNKETNR